MPPYPCETSNPLSGTSRMCCCSPATKDGGGGGRCCALRASVDKDKTWLAWLGHLSLTNRVVQYLRASVDKDETWVGWLGHLSLANPGGASVAIFSPSRQQTPLCICSKDPHQEEEPSPFPRRAGLGGFAHAWGPLLEERCNARCFVLTHRPQVFSGEEKRPLFRAHSPSPRLW